MVAKGTGAAVFSDGVDAGCGVPAGAGDAGVALEPVEDLGKRQPDFACRQFVAFHFVESAGICERLLESGIDDPDMPYSESAVLLEFFQNSAHPIVVGYDFDTEERRLMENVYSGIVECHANVGDTPASSGYSSQPLLGPRKQGWIPLFQKSNQIGLNTAMRSFAHLTLHDNAVYVLPVGRVRSAEILFRGDKSSRIHSLSLALAHGGAA